MSEQRPRKQKPAIDPSLMEPIGQVTVNFAMLEQHLSFGIGCLLHPEQRTGQIVTAELSFRQKVQLFSALFVHRFPDEDGTAIKDLCSRLSTVEQERNLLIHSFWAVSKKAGESMRLKTTAKAKGISFQRAVTNREDVEAVAGEVAEVSAELLDFVWEFSS